MATDSVEARATSSGFTGLKLMVTGSTSIELRQLVLLKPEPLVLLVQDTCSGFNGDRKMGTGPTEASTTANGLTGSRLVGSGLSGDRTMGTGLTEATANGFTGLRQMGSGLTGFRTRPY